MTICQGLVRNYSGLLATRFFLGVTETGTFPGTQTMTILLSAMGGFDTNELLKDVSTSLACGTDEQKHKSDTLSSSAQPP